LDLYEASQETARLAQAPTKLRLSNICAPSLPGATSTSS
jgi:hypothetical protein